MAVKFTKGSSGSLGMDIMRRINEGEIKKAPTKDIESVKSKIVENLGEIIEYGARVRPLMSDGVQIGWCRGVYVSERQALKHWIKDPNDYISHVLQLGTSFSSEEIEAMSAVEIRSLTEVIQQMSSYNSSLIPYLPAYATTHQSENLWYSKGDQLASFENRVLTMPDGKTMRLMLPPDQARIWVSLCTYREQAKRRLEADFNALFIVRPWAGKSADPIQNELQRVARSLAVNAQEPWEEVVRAVRPEIDKNDGWGHPGDSIEDLQRELKGMLEGDKHERLMEAWQAQMKHEGEVAKKERDEKRKARGTVQAGITASKPIILTDKQIRQRQAALKAGKQAQPAGVVRREDHEVEPTDQQLVKIKKYL